MVRIDIYSDLLLPVLEGKSEGNFGKELLKFVYKLHERFDNKGLKLIVNFKLD